MSPRLPRALAGAVTAALVMAVLVLPGTTAGAAKKELPSRKHWLADVREAMKGSKPYVRERVEDAATQTPVPKLAINFDIDNTVIATTYDEGGPIQSQLKFATFVDEHGVALMFNSARLKSQQTAATLKELEQAGFPVTRLCLRRKGETKAAGKQRCRQKFVDQGYTIIANVGNNPTDFEGENYDRGFKLPNYGGRLS